MISAETLQFKAKEVVQYIVYAITAAFLFASQNHYIDRLSDRIADHQAKLEELRLDSKGSQKETQLAFQNLQNQINLNTQQILLLKQEVERITKRQNYYEK